MKYLMKWLPQDFFPAMIFKEGFYWKIVDSNFFGSKLYKTTCKISTIIINEIENDKKYDVDDGHHTPHFAVLRTVASATMTSLFQLRKSWINLNTFSGKFRQLERSIHEWFSKITPFTCTLQAPENLQSAS